jgi:hypothetical protein
MDTTHAIRSVRTKEEENRTERIIYPSHLKSVVVFPAVAVLFCPRGQYIGHKRIDTPIVPTSGAGAIAVAQVRAASTNYSS